MKRIKLTRATVVSGSPAMQGEVFDLPDDRAGYLIAIGKAVALGATIEKGSATTARAFKGLTTENAAGLIKGKRRQKPSDG